MKSFGYLVLLFTIIILNRCSEADAKESKTRSDAFDKIDKRDKKLFTQGERIEAYNKSNNKSESLKKSLTSNNNSGYSGYGSSTKKKKKKSNPEQQNKKVKVKSKPKVNLQFSAYSTN
tara:strand:+ start:1067 stop:1420 length:354 start_codon:yes stop_codon:yes gene_type:complete